MGTVLTVYRSGFIVCHTFVFCTGFILLWVYNTGLVLFTSCLISTISAL